MTEGKVIMLVVTFVTALPRIIEVELKFMQMRLMAEISKRQQGGRFYSFVRTAYPRELRW